MNVATQTEEHGILCGEAKTKGWCCFLTDRCEEKPRILVFWRKSVLDGPKNTYSCL